MLKPFKSLVDDSALYMVVLVIVGAFILGGGHLILEEKDSTTSQAGGATSNPAPEWSIDYIKKGCVTGGADVEITAKGPETGYITLELDNGGGNYSLMSTDEFKFTPTSVWRPILKTATGYSTKPWRLKLFKGGAINGTQWSGGEEKAVSREGTPTSCP